MFFLLLLILFLFFGSCFSLVTLVIFYSVFFLEASIFLGGDGFLCVFLFLSTSILLKTYYFLLYVSKFLPSLRFLTEVKWLLSFYFDFVFFDLCSFWSFFRFLSVFVDLAWCFVVLSFDSVNFVVLMHWVEYLFYWNNLHY